MKALHTCTTIARQLKSRAQMIHWMLKKNKTQRKAAAKNVKNTTQLSKSSKSKEKREHTRAAPPRNRPRKGHRHIQPFQDQDQVQ